MFISNEDMISTLWHSWYLYAEIVFYNILFFQTLCYSYYYKFKKLKRSQKEIKNLKYIISIKLFLLKAKACTISVSVNLNLF